MLNKYLFGGAIALSFLMGCSARDIVQDDPRVYVVTPEVRSDAEVYLRVDKEREPEKADMTLDDVFALFDWNNDGILDDDEASVLHGMAQLGRLYHDLQDRMKEDSE